jgi:hypothetical protein
MWKPLIAITLFISIYSCKKSNHQVDYPVSNVSAAGWAKLGDTSIHYLVNFGHENKTVITKQPQHAIYSEMVMESFGLVYKYRPEDDFHGTDTVIFKSVEPACGCTLISEIWITTHTLECD